MSGHSKLVMAAAMIGTLMLATTASAAPSRRPTVRDLEGYATAACLIQTGDAYLKDQGYRWSSIMVQGEGVPPARLAPLDAAVKVRVAQGGMVIVRDEASPTGDRSLPLVFCARIVDAPGVRAAIVRLSAHRG